MHKELRERFITALLTGDQAKEVLLVLNRAIGTSDGHYLSDDDFEALLIEYSEED